MVVKIEPQFNLPAVYQDVIKYLTNDDTKTHITLLSGRSSGKSENVGRIAIITTFTELDNNILVLRATKTQIRTSSFAMFSNIIHSMGLEQFFRFRTKAMTIENLVTGSMIYFEGVEDDPEKIKGFTPRNNKIAMVIFEEFTELSSFFPIGIAIETLVRFRGSDSNDGVIKFVKMGNPSRWNSHWSWDAVEVDEKNPKAFVFTPMWTDIQSYLNKHTVEYILNLKETNRRYYDWAYEGKRVSYEGLVYEQFGEHTLTDMSDFEGKRPVAFIAGLDPASKRDKTAVVIMILFNTGQMVAMDMWMHDPKEEGSTALAPSQQGERIVKFLNNWLYKPENINYRFLPKFLITDPASGGLDVEIRNLYGSQINVLNVDRKERLKDIARNQNALATGRLKFKRDEDGLTPLFDELSMLLWREKYINKELRDVRSTQLTIGEDDCHDAMTYAITFGLTNARFMKYNADLLNIDF